MTEGQIEVPPVSYTRHTKINKIFECFENPWTPINHHFNPLINRRLSQKEGESPLSSSGRDKCPRGPITPTTRARELGSFKV